MGELVIVHDASYINAQSALVWRETFLRALVQVVLIALITLLIVRWSIAGPIARAAQWMKALRIGRAGGIRAAMPDLDLLRPLAREMETLAESLTAARSAAEKEAQLREAGESVWTPERLSVHVRGKLGNSRLFVVSNREPLQPRSARQYGASHCSGQRTGHRVAARAVRLRRNLGGARQWRRRPGDRGRPRPPACPSSGSQVHAAKSLADERGRRRLLLRFRQRRPVAPLPYRSHAADVSRLRLGALRQGQREVCQSCTGRDGRHRSSRCSWSRTTTLRYCRAW